MKLLTSALLLATTGFVSAQNEPLPYLSFGHPLEVGISAIEVEMLFEEAPPYRVELWRDRGGVQTVVGTTNAAERYHRFDLAKATQDGDSYTTRVFHPAGVTNLAGEVRRFRGDFNLDGVVDVADVSSMLSHLFGGTAVPPFSEPLGDVNGDGAMDIGDPTALLSYLFQSGAEPVPYDLPASFAAPGTETAADITGLITTLAEQFDSNLADYAYTRLFHLGDQAVTPLIQAAQTIIPGQLFTGCRCFHAESNHVGLPVRFAAACLSLVDSMRLGYPSTFLYPEFLDGAGAPVSDADLAQVADDYESWDQAQSGVPVENRPAVLLTDGSIQPPHPAPRLTPDHPWLDPQWGTPEPGSSSYGGWFRWCYPREDVCAADGTTCYWRTCWFVIFNHPYYPYAVKEVNCLAWAFHQQDWWWWGPDGDIDATMEENGYEGGGSSVPWPGVQNIAVIHWLCPDQIPSAATAKHVMRQQENGKWESKNGRNFLYTDICDIWDFIFLGEHYDNPPPGKSIYIEYYRPMP